MIDSTSINEGVSGGITYDGIVGNVVSHIEGVLVVIKIED
jgi:ABC-type glucose/galactose transport system permease subunit